VSAISTLAAKPSMNRRAPIDMSSKVNWRSISALSTQE